MATKKVYPFIRAKMFDLEGNKEEKDVVFDAREVESCEFWTDEDGEENKCVKVNFKSGKEMYLSQTLYPVLYHGDDLKTVISRVQFSHFWHDNDDSIPDEDEE